MIKNRTQQYRLQLLLLVAVTLVLLPSKAAAANDDEEELDCPPVKNVVAKYHWDSVCSKFEQNLFEDGLNRPAQRERIQQAGIYHVPNQKTLVCPEEPVNLFQHDDIDYTNDPIYGIGFPKKWIVHNHASSPVVVAWIDRRTDDHPEVSSVDGMSIPAHADPEAIIQPGDFGAFDTYDGHVFTVRQLLPAGNSYNNPQAYHGYTLGPLLLQHRVGLIPIRNTFDHDLSQFCDPNDPDVEPHVVVPDNNNITNTTNNSSDEETHRELMELDAAKPVVQANKGTPDSAETYEEQVATELQGSVPHVLMADDHQNDKTLEDPQVPKGNNVPAREQQRKRAHPKRQHQRDRPARKQWQEVNPTPKDPQPVVVFDTDRGTTQDLHTLLDGNQHEEVAPEFRRTMLRTTTDELRPCNTLDIGFRNLVGCPLHVYYSGLYIESGTAKDANASCSSTPKTCHEQFKFHLGKNPFAEDFMEGWDSQHKFETTFVGHHFVFRLAAQDDIVVDTVTVEPTFVTDCPHSIPRVPKMETQRALRGAPKRRVKKDKTDDL